MTFKYFYLIFGIKSIILIMKRILALAGLILMFYVYDDIKESKHEQEILRIKAHENDPDRNRKVDHWDWEENRWIYKDELKPNDEPLDYEFEPSLDSTLVEPEEDYEALAVPILVPYVERFITYSKIYGEWASLDKDFIAYFDSNIRYYDGAVGQCEETPYLLTIKLDPTFWVNDDVSIREAIFMHEAGHCLLNRPHDNRTKNGMALSIMHQDIYYYAKDYEVNKDYYLRELFQNKSQLYYEN